MATYFDWDVQRVLIIAPHPDDEVLGCGGLISRVKREGGEVHVLYVTAGEVADFSLAGRSTAAEKLREIEKVAESFSLDGWHLALPGDKHNLRLDILPRSQLVDLLERPGNPLAFPTLKPSVVLAPDPTSYNQDHQAVASAVLTALRPGPDAFRHQPTAVLTYEEAADSWSAQPALVRNVFVELAADDVDRKVATMALHASQWREHPHTRSKEALRGLAVLRGAQSGYRYAEAFHLLRWRA
ncbi:PIG-L deacetylase family protein [Nocardia pneumoniae]|uniref:PIG-L deacetylase family protein n=1 Tax=Nocardia pneumoniae TaxID=228601 RepID=UPI00030D2431|nr:PIG-L deacetylase family protein [Nocardia pneumoniae]